LGKRRDQVLPESEGVGTEEEWGQQAGGEMAQTMYTHMNKCINNFKKRDRG
jgi:hypothetical protein